MRRGYRSTLHRPAGTVSNCTVWTVELRGVLMLAPSNRRLALATLIAPVLLIALDMTVLGAALPAISEDMRPGAATQLWIVGRLRAEVPRDRRGHDGRRGHRRRRARCGRVVRAPPAHRRRPA